ncbi:AAA family ATPase [Xanthomonas campestris pv. campestris]|uniref:AAA family ATPase n=1 Tax=Xanthomonas campestris TaxID=339 RepID=UPI0008392BED|nr:AAA family ATPase [Xanthomonas campestris]MCC5051397.1 AAA family ATPase [Xanthomonas campestris pv. aberrans]MCF8868936.1 AAA family ATPase [Xanthomonas campestris pv. campestris]MDM7672293.1 AAA family ATPase [Xanthomonas campestris pv. campestris]MDM7693079.1 AAA family ATPase [Xanthomonas campestris pv. campestris]MDM7714618.1 AAA family ATPase [Xanthomonas campestris pv. campestris]
MIREISIHRHKSFHPTNAHSVQIPNKTATYVYGLNGAGKSAIGEVVDGLARADTAFAHCRIETTDNARYRYLVYNHHYVERLIGQPIQGIFTVGEVDTVRQKRIQEIDARNDELDGLIAGATASAMAAKDNVAKEFVRAKDDIWKAHDWGKKTALSLLLEGYGRNKEKFFTDLRTHVLPAEGQLDTIERLEKRWADVSGTESERSSVSFDTTALTGIERDPIWGEMVEVSTTSRLAPLVAELGNADWVARGQAYTHTDQCPFCQEDLPHDFRDELARLLEGERKAKVDRISLLVQNYAAQLDALEQRAQTILAYPDAKEVGVELAWSQTRAAFHDTLSALRQKKAQPGMAVSIAPVDVDALVEALAKLNALITDFNARIRDRKGERDRIKAMFFQVMHAERTGAYAHHDALLVPLQDAETQAKADLHAKRQEQDALNTELRDLRRLQKGIDASIDAINERLRSLGITAFSIDRKVGEDRVYCLARPGVASSETKSLSEGEKTLIAFLYFMESLKGSHDENESVDPRRTIAVIDDPISSLSQNYVYDIATMIHRELAKPKNRPQLVKQVIVLTHNLFFFHELIRQHIKNLANAHNHCGLLRVVKNAHSEVETLDPTKLLNDYDVWWQILRDAKDGKIPSQIVPNAMRNILEQFFTFTTGSSDFPEAVQRLADADASSKYAALDRFVDRGSHRDAINGPPIDWTEYDVPYLLGKFRAMFNAIGQEPHYFMKMGEDNPEQEHA